jgi:hypothetical protein
VPMLRKAHAMAQAKMKLHGELETELNPRL